MGRLCSRIEGVQCDQPHRRIEIVRYDDTQHAPTTPIDGPAKPERTPFAEPVEKCGSQLEAAAVAANFYGKSKRFSRQGKIRIRVRGAFAARKVVGEFETRSIRTQRRRTRCICGCACKVPRVAMCRIEER